MNGPAERHPRYTVTLIVTLLCCGFGCTSTDRGVATSTNSPHEIQPADPGPARFVSGAAGETTSSGQARLAQPLPEMAFENAPAQSVVDALSDMSRQADGDGGGVDIILVPRRGAGQGGGGTSTVSLALRRVTLLEALQALCEVADLEMRIRHGVVYLYPAGAAPRGMETRVYSVQPALLETIVEREMDGTQ